MKTSLRSLVGLLAFILAPAIALAQYDVSVGSTTFVLPLQMLDSSDHLTPKTGLTLTCNRIKNGTRGTCAGSSAEVDSVNVPGAYKYTVGATDTDTAGSVAFYFTSTGADPFRKEIQVGTFDVNVKTVAGVAPPPVYDGTISTISTVTLTLSAGVASSSAWNNGVRIGVFDPTTGALKAQSCITGSSSGAGTVTTRTDISSKIATSDNYIIAGDNGCFADVEVWKGTTAAAVDTAGYPIVTVKNGTGSGELQTASGRTKADVSFWSGSAVTSPDVAGSPKVTLTAGTGTGQISLTSGAVTAGTVSDKTGYSLSSTQTFNNTGNLTGNVSGSVGSVTGNVGGNVTGSVGSVVAGVTVGTNGLPDTAITANAGNKLADMNWRRNSANIEASANGDTLNFQSPYGAVAQQTNNLSVSGNNLNIYKQDGTTVLKTRTTTTASGAAPITGLGTN